MTPQMNYLEVLAVTYADLTADIASVECEVRGIKESMHSDLWIIVEPEVKTYYRLTEFYAMREELETQHADGLRQLKEIAMT